MKLISWNIDSLNAALTSDSNRALLTREVLRNILALNPDIIAIQETKLTAKELTKKHAEGRIITLEFEDLFVTQVYTPNAGNTLGRLEDRQIWDQKYAEYLSQLDQTKPVLAVGDFNVAHEEIDLAHPDRNHFSAGFTDEERQGFTHLLAQGFTDTFRHLHGDIEGVYTWWAQRVKTSKINNSGWRIDYALVSDRLADKVVKSEMLDSGIRQDHTPLLIELEF